MVSSACGGAQAKRQIHGAWVSGDKTGFDLSATEAAAALRWWVQAGVEFTLVDSPRDQFASADPDSEPKGAPPRRAAEPSREPVSSTPARAGLNLRPDEAALAARDLAAASADLNALRSSLERFEGCALKKTATQLVFADGTPGSRVMLVGEAPGADEDRIGRPFVGRAGQLLDRMLAAIGLDRRLVYIANVVPWRPPGNRTPTPQETQACLPFIKRQIELAEPEILVCLGASATQTLLQAPDGITRARGRWFSYSCEDGRTLQAIAMFHPAYLLRQPAQKRNAWADLRALAAVLKG